MDLPRNDHPVNIIHKIGVGGMFAEQVLGIIGQQVDAIALLF